MIDPTALFCPIRKAAVNSSPEEKVRVGLLHYLIGPLGFPASGIVLEKQLRHMPHLKTSAHTFPDRRADIVCFANGEEGLYPLLLIECKAVKLTPKMFHQVLGYNHFLQARYVCLINEDEVQTGWFDPEKREYVFVNSLPSFTEISHH
jgi:hypothetical protein